MADGLLGAALGDEDEKPEVEAPDALAVAEAFASAVAAKLAGNDPEVARHTCAFLQEQTQLLEVQRKHLKEEHALRIAHLGNQLNEETVRRFGLRLRVGVQLFIVLIATVIGIGVAVMIHDAVTSRSVVIDPFETSPNLVTQVPSGKIVAAGLLDVLTRIQSASRSNAQRRSLSNAWTNEIAIEVPETGISIGQLERMLKARFGHDQHIDGELVPTEKGGLALTVRGTGILPKTFTDGARNLDKLLTEAGEYVYSQSQPGLWAAYLRDERPDETISFVQHAYPTAAPAERPYLLNAWANTVAASGREGALTEALPLWREAIRLNPDFWSGYMNIMFALDSLGDEEGAVRVGKEMMKLSGGRPGRAPEAMYANYDEKIWDLPALRASDIADMESHGGIGTLGTASGSENLNVALVEVRMHDTAAAALRLKTTLVDEKNVPTVAAAAMVRALLAEERGDLKAAAQAWDAFGAAYADPTVSISDPPYICFSAVTYEKTGQRGKADAALKPFGNGTFVDCYRFRGDVLDIRGDWSGAQEWYAKAVKLGLSIPSGYYSWGLALAAHGDFVGATEKFNVANQQGPHWADPLKAWGDALAKQGNARDALMKYDEAARYAPNWKELKDAREALAQQHR